MLIAGPTASGKSALALGVARERGGVIINADALQVYGELRVLSARPTDHELDAVPHRLYGHVSGRESYSVAAWLAEAKREIADAWGRGLVPIITGGTGLYFMALEKGLAQVPTFDISIREKWRNFEGDIHAELQRLDPVAAARLKANDRQRIARALEVVEGTGQPLSHWQAKAQSEAYLADVEIERIMVAVPRNELYARAERRFDQMMDAGALDEVKAIADLDSSLPMMRAIGVPELIRHLQGELGLEQAIALAKIATRQFIKRQLTWGRGQAKGWGIATPHIDDFKE